MGYSQDKERVRFVPTTPLGFSSPMKLTKCLTSKIDAYSNPLGGDGSAKSRGDSTNPGEPKGICCITTWIILIKETPEVLPEEPVMIEAVITRHQQEV